MSVKCVTDTHILYMIDIIPIEVLQRKRSGAVLTRLSPCTSLENHYLRDTFETTVVAMSAFDAESLCNQALAWAPLVTYS